MTDVIVKIMVEVLSIFAIATKEIKQGRASTLFPSYTLISFFIGFYSEKYLKRLVGRRDIEDALQRLDKLTQEEARMATAEVLRLTQNVGDKVKGIGDQVKGVDGRVQGVDHKMRAVDDRMKEVDDRVRVVNDNVKLIVDGAWHLLICPRHHPHTSVWLGGKERSVAIERIVNSVGDMNRP